MDPSRASVQNTVFPHNEFTSMRVFQKMGLSKASTQNALFQKVSLQTRDVFSTWFLGTAALKNAQMHKHFRKHTIFVTSKLQLVRSEQGEAPT